MNSTINQFKKLVIFSFYSFFFISYNAFSVGESEGQLSRSNIMAGSCNIATITAKYKLGTLFGEPTVNGNFSWDAGDNTPADCLHYSTNIAFKIQSGTAHGYIYINPVVPDSGNGFGSNNTGSPNWNKLICGLGNGYRDSCVTSEQAKAFFTNGYIITEFFIVGQDGAVYPGSSNIGGDGNPESGDGETLPPPPIPTTQIIVEGEDLTERSVMKGFGGNISAPVAGYEIKSSNKDVSVNYYARTNVPWLTFYSDLNVYGNPGEGISWVGSGRNRYNITAQVNEYANYLSVGVHEALITIMGVTKTFRLTVTKAAITVSETNKRTTYVDNQQPLTIDDLSYTVTNHSSESVTVELNLQPTKSNQLVFINTSLLTSITLAPGQSETITLSGTFTSRPASNKSMFQELNASFIFTSGGATYQIIRSSNIISYYFMLPDEYFYLNGSVGNSNSFEYSPSLDFLVSPNGSKQGNCSLSIENRSEFEYTQNGTRFMEFTLNLSTINQNFSDLDVGKHTVYYLVTCGAKETYIPLNITLQSDYDKDGVYDADDAFFSDPTESKDTDKDGIGNNLDLDDDNDGVPDTEDESPLNPLIQIDTDRDGIDNKNDLDDDGDGVNDFDDLFPLDDSESSDFDNDGLGDSKDTDSDNDGVENRFDEDPLNAEIGDSTPPVFTANSNQRILNAQDIVTDFSYLKNYSINDNNLKAEDFPVGSSNSGTRISIELLNEDLMLTMGEHTLKWKATDDAGNESFYNEDVLVKDTSPPVLPIELLESAIHTVVMAKGDYTNLNAHFNFTAIDKIDGEVDVHVYQAFSEAEINGDLSIVEKLPLQSVGFSGITFAAQDSKGNMVTKYMNVIIIPKVMYPEKIELNNSFLAYGVGSEAAIRHRVPIYISQPDDTTIVEQMSLSTSKGQQSIFNLPNLNAMASTFDDYVDVESVSGSVIVSLNSIQVPITRYSNEKINFSLGNEIISVDDTFTTIGNKVTVMVGKNLIAPKVSLRLTAGSHLKSHFNIESNHSMFSIIPVIDGVELGTERGNVSNEYDIYWSSENTSLQKHITNNAMQSLNFSTSSLTEGTYMVTAEFIAKDQSHSFIRDLVFQTLTGYGDLSRSHPFTDYDMDRIPQFIELKDTDTAAWRLKISDIHEKISTELGLRLTIGDILAATPILHLNSNNEMIDAKLPLDLLAKLGNGVGGPVMNSNDNYNHITSILNFNLQEMRIDDLVNSIIIPLERGKALPEHALYRLYSPESGWFTFIENGNNKINSAPLTIHGNCPMATSVDYQSGLIAGNHCVELVIEEGGVNDFDNKVNGIYRHVGVIAVDTKISELIINRPTVESVTSDDLFELTVTVDTNSEQSSLVYSWTQLKGSSVVELADYNSNILKFTAPLVNSSEVIEFELTVSDGIQTSKQVIQITVNAKSVSTTQPLAISSSESSGGGISFIWLFLLILTATRVRYIKF
jgi:hypothetical protein